MRYSTCRGDWMKHHVGARVCHGEELKHVGTLLFIRGGIARVRWDDTGWLSDIAVTELTQPEE